MINITVSGPAGSGKSAVAVIIQERLAELGCQVFLNDEHDPHCINESTAESMVRSLHAGHGQNTRVMITTQQVRRHASLTGDEGFDEATGD